MTKYEELHIGNKSQSEIFKDILVGDRLTLEVGGGSEEESTVRTVHEIAVRTPGKKLRNAPAVAVLKTLCIAVDDIPRYGLYVTKIERPVPEVELPTAPGYYESAKMPLRNGWAAFRLEAGQWHSASQLVSVRSMHSHMPLTRLVPETEAVQAKLRDRIDVNKMDNKLRHFVAEGHDWRGISANIITAIDNGELDK